MIAEVFLGSHAASSPSLPGSSPVSLFRLLTIRRFFDYSFPTSLSLSKRTDGLQDSPWLHSVLGYRFTGKPLCHSIIKLSKGLEQAVCPLWYVREGRLEVFGLQEVDALVVLPLLPSPRISSPTHRDSSIRDYVGILHLDGLPWALVDDGLNSLPITIDIIKFQQSKYQVAEITTLNQGQAAHLFGLPQQLVGPVRSCVWPAPTHVELVDLEGVVDLLLLQQVESPLVLMPLAQRLPTPRSETELDDLSWLTEGASVREEQFVLSDSELKAEGARMVANSDILAGAEGDDVVMVDAFSSISPEPVNYELKDLLSNISEKAVEQLRHFYEIPQNVTFRRPKKRGEAPGWERGGNHSAFSLSGGKPARSFPLDPTLVNDIKNN
ncbi:hypothetical protein FNV43_RR02406 [Rhamnella rubrinervis]|uniref:Uncharacterized protein n=1 Tax=Rhamnella rubrinervis TaxID=2594499 RepID=A0A8K0MT74_9ROSA|nr:hypothetical protein FNV43_RR02406 [Rhamnella rubrinervis]